MTLRKNGRGGAAKTALAGVLALAFAIVAGCGNEQPVSSADSGLRPTDGDSSSGGGEDAPSGGGDSDAVPAMPPDEPDPSDGGPGTIPPQPPTDPPAAKGLEVPEGDAAALSAFLDQLEGRLQRHVSQLQGTGLSPEASDVVLSELKQIMEARITAAGRLLAADGATPEQREEAVDVKLDGLGFLEQIGESVADRRTEFVASIKDDRQPGVRRTASILVLEEEVNAFAGGKVEDPGPMLARLKELLGDEQQELSGQLFRTAQSVSNALFNVKKMEEGLSVLRLASERFGKSDDPRIVAAAGQLAEEAGFIELDMRQKDVAAGEPMSVEAFMQTVQNLLAVENPGMQTLMLVSHYGRMLKDEHAAARDQTAALVGKSIDQMLGAEKVSGDTLAQLSQFAVQAEYSGDIPLAKRLHAGLLAAADKAGEAEEAERVREQIAKAQQRVGLIGQPLEVTGALPDGAEFDWEKYRGKVVLVDFWATWCRPCLAEIPNIQANYDKYKDQGFEVIGVNLDDDVKQLDDFVARSPLPWPSVVSADAAARGFATPLAAKCGVNAIPFVLLIGKDGKVLDIHTRGERLGEKLAELFGPVEEAAPDDPAGGGTAVPDGPPATGE